MIVFMLSCRIGEARVPGPDNAPTWTLGTCNPSGLHGKQAILNQISADVLAVSESHLSKAGTRHLSAGLRSIRSPFRRVLTGSPMQPRTVGSDAGQYAGVAFLATVPSRVPAVPWPPDLYETGRIQFGSFFTSMAWVTGAVVYGYPEGKVHLNAKARTAAILDFAFEHVRQLPGPRFLTGDWNYTIGSLDVVSSLHDAGWVEVQDLFAQRTGAAVCMTCKQVSRKDFLFLSPELAMAFVDLSVHQTIFADHAVLCAHFAGGSNHLERFVWPCPKPVPWSRVGPLGEPVSFAAPLDPTAQYAALWSSRERAAASALPDVWVPSMAGRGQQTKPHRKVHAQAPLKAGRSDDVQPAFFGFSSVHAKQFRQLRRLQNFCRWAENKDAIGLANHEHGVALWTSILRAPGFSPTFASWWHHRQYVCPHDPADVPQFCPSAAVARQIFEVVLAEVRLLEQRLDRAKAAYRKTQHEVDKNLVFRDVARPCAAPVESLIHEVQSKVAEVDAAECAIVLPSPQTFDAAQPLWVAGQAREIIHAEHDKVWLTDVSGIGPEAGVAQRQEIGHLRDVFEAFHSQWKERWCRHDDLPFSHWDAIIGFARQIMRPIAIPHLEICPDLLLAEVHRKKKRSATGLDGVSRDDLIQADLNTVLSLTGVYRRAELDGCWPSQIVAGKVHSLAKTELAATVSQYRPITIFGLPYRIWSSLQSRHLLQWAESWVDEGVYGNRKGRQASDLWHFMLQQIEHAYATGSMLCGVSADIEKCFNCIPRYPALCLAVLTGTPAQVTTAWAGALSSMCRHFKVRDSFSPGFLTSTGLAEGCGLSVFGMLLVDHVFACWMRVQAPAITTLSYVDDWQCLTWDPDFAVRQLTLVESFAAMLDLTVDRKKTFAWSTDAATRGVFRVGGLLVCHQARELGGHFGVSRQYTNRTVKQRIDALDDLWPKLSQSKARYPAKVFILRAVAWPRGLHAIPSAPLVHSVWVQLRRHATKALGLQRPGVNSFVLLGLVEASVDPQFVALLLTCRSVRTQYAVDFGSSLLAPLASGHLDLPPSSPASVVLGRLQHVGMSIDRFGRIVDRFGALCLHTTNPAEVELRLLWGWVQFVACKVAHRPEFAGLHLVNPAATRQFLKKLPPDDQALVRLGLSGGLFTESYKAKWTDQSDHCIWCGQVDSMKHRYWECPQHQDLRDQLAPLAQTLVDLLPPALSLRGWALHPPTWEAWISALTALPSTILAPVANFVQGRVNHVFTDGSCLGQADPRLRLASWAAILVPSVDSDWTPGSSVVLGASVLAGLCQTAFRAELTAVAFVLHWAACQGTAVCVWTDCAGVVNRYNLTFWGYRRINLNKGNADLWLWIQQSVEILGRDRIQLRKVPAHRSLHSAQHRQELWMIYHNNLVDKAARLANQARPPQFWNLWLDHVKATYAADEIFAQVAALQLAVAKRHVRAQGDGADDQPVDAPRQTRTFDVDFDLQGWNGQPLPQLAQTFGDAHAARVVRWFHARLTTGPDSEIVWVSFIQLYVDFQLCWGNPGPLRVCNQWVDVASRQYLSAEQHPFRARVRWFRQLVKALVAHAGIRAGFAQCRPRSEAVLTFVPSISVPWNTFALHEVDGWLLRHLGAPCTRAANCLAALPIASRCSRMEV